MKKIIKFIVSISWFILQVIFLKKVSEIYEYQGFIFLVTGVEQLIYSLLVIIVTFIFISRVKKDFKGIFMMILILLMYVPTMVYLIFTRYNQTMLIAYNLTMLILFIIIYILPSIRFEYKVNSQLWYSFLKKAHLVVSCILIIKLISTGSLSYIFSKSSEIDVYVIREMSSNGLNSKLINYMLLNYISYFGILIPVLTIYRKEKNAFLYTGLFFCVTILSGHKSPIVYFMITICLAKLILGRIGIKSFIKFFVSSISMLIIFSIALATMYGSNSIYIYILSIIRRGLFLTTLIAEFYFIEFTTKSEFLLFRMFIDKNYNRQIYGMDLQVYISQKYMNANSYANTNFIASSFTECGYISLILYAIILGIIVKFVDSLICQNRLNRNRVILAIATIPCILPLTNTAFTTCITNFGIAIMVIINIMLKDLN